MLGLIRKKQKTTLVKFVFWAIIATFVGTIFLVWGKGNERASDGGSIAVSINDTHVTVQNYQMTYRNLYQFYQNLYGDKFNAEMEKQLGLTQTAIDQLVRQVLLEQEGNRLDLEVTQQELVDSIAKIPQFQKDGIFDRQTYLQVLDYQRISPEDFETSQESLLFAGKVEEQIMSAISVGDSDIEAEYRKQNEKVNLTFARLAPALFENKVKVDTAALEKYLSDNQETFRKPAIVSLRYLQFEPGHFVDEVVLDEAALNKYYKRHLDQFEIEEQVSAAHILIKLAKDADAATRDEKKKLAEKVLGKAQAGEDFSKLARKYSDDTGSAAKGGALGYFKRGSMVPAFEKAVFTLNPGEISEIVESPFGLHIIKVDGYIEADIKPLDEVVETVKTALKKELSVQVAFEKAMDAYNINRKTGDLDKAAKDNNIGLKETGLFDRDRPIDGIGQSSEIVAAAFALEKGKLARPIRLDSGIFLITLKERQESHIPKFAEVKKQVETAYRKIKSAELAKGAAEEMLAALNAGKKLAKLARESGAKIEETGLFAQSYGAFIPRLGNAEELAKQAFALTEGNNVAPEVYELGGRFVVVVLKELQPADMEKLNSEKREQLRETVNNNLRREILEAKIAELKKAALIEYAPYLISLLGKG